MFEIIVAFLLVISVKWLLHGLESTAKFCFDRCRRLLLSSNDGTV